MVKIMSYICGSLSSSQIIKLIELLVYKARAVFAMAIMRRFCCDDETGEIITYKVNKETGEPFLDNIKMSPPQDTEATCTADTPPPKYMKFPQGYMSHSKKFQSLKANILAGSNTVSHRLLLIPSVLIIFPGLFCILLAALEVYLHVRCHKKNKKLKDPTLYYRSPFHIISRTFCGVCRDCDTASKIGQMQDQRRHRYDYFRGIAI